MGKKTAARKAWLRPRLRVMCGKEIALGPGRVELLELIRQTRSLRAAAERMDISYMRAWQLVQYTNRCFREPLVEVTRGGRAGGGAKLTKTGVRVLKLYRQMESQCHKAVRKTWSELERRVGKRHSSG